MRVNPGHHQHHRDKAQNCGTVPPIPGQLASPGQGPKLRDCPAHSGTVSNYAPDWWKVLGGSEDQSLGGDAEVLC